MRVERRRLVERWWNGQYGRMARRDLWLWQGDDRWTVERCIGALDDGRRREWTFRDEETARRMLRTCIDTGGEGWRRLPHERTP